MFHFAAGSLRILPLATISPLFFRPSVAAPVPLALLSQQSPTSHKVGGYLAIAFGVLLFAAIIFYLGVYRGRTGSWRFWRRSRYPDQSLSRATKRSSNGTDLRDWEKDDGSEPEHRWQRPEIRVLGTSTAMMGSQNGFDGYGYPHMGEEARRQAQLETEQMIFEAGIHTPRRDQSPATRSLRESGSAPIYELGPGIRSVEQINIGSPAMMERRKRWSWRLGFNNASRWSASTVTQDGTARPSMPPSLRLSPANISLQEHFDTASLPPSHRSLGTPLRSPRQPSAEAASIYSVERDIRSDVASVSTNGMGGSMNWEGLEWLKKMYRQRSSIYRASWNWRFNNSSVDVHSIRSGRVGAEREADGEGEVRLR